MGLCGVRPMREGYEPSWETTVMLARAGLMSSVRGHGIHRRMIKRRLVWAKQQGFKRAVSYTMYDNIPAIKNLLREGFVPYLGDHEGWLWLEKTLG